MCRRCTTSFSTLLKTGRRCGTTSSSHSGTRVLTSRRTPGPARRFQVSPLPHRPVLSWRCEGSDILLVRGKTDIIRLISARRTLMSARNTVKFKLDPPGGVDIQREQTANHATPGFGRIKLYYSTATAPLRSASADKWAARSTTARLQPMRRRTPRPKGCSEFLPGRERHDHSRTAPKLVQHPVPMH
jgi:hypothetical protein